MPERPRKSTKKDREEGAKARNKKDRNKRK
jgi:hypothetical protein